MYQQNILQGPGTGTFTTHTAEILIMLIGAFLFGLWFGWVLWSRYRQTAEKLRLDNESLSGSVSALNNDLAALKTKLADTEAERSAQAIQVQNLGWENETYRSRIAVLESDMAKVQERNLQLETELGMAVQPGNDGSIPLEIAVPVQSEPHEELPNEVEAVVAGAIDETFDKAHLDMPELEDAIADAVTTALAEHHLPVMEAEPPALPLTEAPNETPVIVPPAFDVLAPASGAGEEQVVAAVVAGPRDDLKIVEGIGPKIEELLFKAGVTTYGHLAATSVQQLKNILADAGPRFAMHDPGTWSAQALLAANGEWDNLKAYQDFLNAGKRPDK